MEVSKSLIISNPQLAEKLIVKCKNLLSNTISILRHKKKKKKNSTSHFPVQLYRDPLYDCVQNNLYSIA